MNSPPLIVCEKSGRWAAWIRRSLERDLLKLRQTRSMTECWEELTCSPQSLLALEVTPDNLEPVVERLTLLRDEFPLARAIVMLDVADAEVEWLCREAGAVYVAQSLPDLKGAMPLLRRHLEQCEVDTEQNEWLSDLQERLPWSPQDA